MFKRGPTKTMTLNLPEKEMMALEELAKEKDMSKTAVMRQALRVYQAISIRMNNGAISPKDWHKLMGVPDMNYTSVIEGNDHG